MRFSIRVQYGLQAMLELALNHGGGPVQIGEIAISQKVPVRFLEQILLVLKRRGLAASRRGKKGGYLLAKRPSEISMLEIVEALDGPIEFTGKKMNKSPVLYAAFEKFQDKFKNELRELTLEDLFLKKRQEERAYIYHI